ncbi:MAG: M24 family metallopeptidase [Nitrososphaera sp.]|jgi:Xaa-Pro aminopeptidase
MKEAITERVEQISKRHDTTDTQPGSMKPLFPKAEFESRLERLRLAMKDSGLDVAIATAPVNIFWTSGYLGSPSHRKTPEFIHAASYPWVLVPQSGEPVIVGNAGALVSYEKETTISRIYTHHPTKDRVPSLVDALRSEHLISDSSDGKRIGLDFGDYESMLVPQYQNLAKLLAGSARVTDATDLFQRTRILRSNREIESLRIASDIQNRAFAMFFRNVQKGMNELELTALMERCQYDCGSTESGNALVWTHPSYALFKRQYPDRLMKDGDVQWVDGGAVYNGYHADYDQLLVYGSANSKQLHTFGAMKKTYDQAIPDFFRQNKPFSEIARQVMALMKKNGLQNPLEPEIFLGHNLGYLMVEPPYFGTFTDPSLVLKPGMVIAPEWFTMTEYGPILYERNYVVRQDGSLEEISRFEKELVEVGNR